ncbi:MAG: sarcosine oxidase subunit gamma [Sphingomonadales bacterium]
MARLVRKSPLGGQTKIELSGLQIHVEPHLGKVSLQIAPDAASLKAVRQAIGLTPSQQPNRFMGKDVQCAWLAPKAWLLLCPPGEERKLTEKLRSELAADDHHCVTDVTDRSVALRIIGPLSRDLLAKGCPLDLHPRGFAAGHCARTIFAGFQIFLQQLDDTPVFRLMIDQSHAPALWDWLSEAAGEFSV